MFESQITRGIEFLDSQFENWIDKIDLSVFDMGDPKKCVLSQLCETRYHLARRFVNIDFSDAIDYGLDVGNTKYYPVLTREWKERIKNLKMASSGELKLNTNNILDVIPEPVLEKKRVLEMLERFFVVGMETVIDQNRGEKKTGREVFNELLEYYELND